MGSLRGQLATSKQTSGRAQHRPPEAKPIRNSRDPFRWNDEPTGLGLSTAFWVFDSVSPYKHQTLGFGNQIKSLVLGALPVTQDIVERFVFIRRRSLVSDYLTRQKADFAFALQDPFPARRNSELVVVLTSVNVERGAVVKLLVLRISSCFDLCVPHQDDGTLAADDGNCSNALFDKIPRRALDWPGSRQGWAICVILGWRQRSRRCQHVGTIFRGRLGGGGQTPDQ